MTDLYLKTARLLVDRDGQLENDKAIALAERLVRKGCMSVDANGRAYVAREKLADAAWILPSLVSADSVIGDDIESKRTRATIREAQLRAERTMTEDKQAKAWDAHQAKIASFQDEVNALHPSLHKPASRELKALKARKIEELLIARGYSCE